MRPVRLSVLTAAAVVAALTAVTGCAEKSDSAGGDGAIHVTATDTACEVSKKDFPAGKATIEVENKGAKVTELYLLFPDGRIVAERENIGPGTKASITAEIKAGDYEIACKPGMKGDGIRQQVKATGSGAVEKRSPEADAAVSAYRTYVQEQADETLPKAQAFADAVKAGDLEAAKKAYALSRIGWERTEPVAESFGDIDPKVDVREDGLEAGQDPAKDWTGWHRLEKSLFQDGKITDQDKKLADTLMADLTDWQKKVGQAEITPPPRWPTAPRSSSTRSPPARSPARKSATPTPTWSTSRPTSRARRRRTSCSSRSPRRTTRPWPPSSTSSSPR
ncbi:hypothetical protein GCM10020254_58350 [Streptomyces goshikiensis]